MYKGDRHPLGVNFMGALETAPFQGLPLLSSDDSEIETQVHLPSNPHFPLTIPWLLSMPASLPGLAAT